MLLEVIFSALSVIIVIPVALLSFEIILALIAIKIVTPDQEGVLTRPDIVVLVPAHNEEKVITETLEQVRPQLTSSDKLLVVADNCSDNTADIARQSGALVIERRDLNHIGKGFALGYGIQYLSKTPPDVVVIIDADSNVEDGLIEKIASVSFSKNRPVQALYLMKNTSLVPSLKERLAEFAWRIKNYARPLGLKFIGLSCQLMGSGMAVPFNQIINVNLANGNLVEDMQLGLDLAAIGSPPFFYSDAKLTSQFPDSIQATEGQRKRWEHGHMWMIICHVPAMLIKSIVSRNFMLFSLVLDLIIPPLTLLAILVFLVFSAAGSLFVITGAENSFYISGISLLLFGITVFMAWVGFGRDLLSISEVLLLPIQMLRKIPLYLQFLFNRQKKWDKTDRD